MLLREDVWPVTSHVGVDDAGVHVVDDDVGAVVLVEALLLDPGANCTKLDLLGKWILGDYFKESRTSKRPFLLLRIIFREDLFLYNSSLVSALRATLLMQ